MTDEMLLVCSAAHKWPDFPRLFTPLPLSCSEESFRFQGSIRLLDNRCLIGGISVFFSPLSFPPPLHSSLSPFYYGLVSLAWISTFTISELILRFRQFPERFAATVARQIRNRKTRFSGAYKNGRDNTIQYLTLSKIGSNTISQVH